MENASDEGFDLDENESCSPVDSYNGHVFAVDELSNSVMLCTSKDGKAMEQATRNLVSVENSLEPHVHMEFNSRDEAREFYINYGRRLGFTVRIHHNRRSRINNMVIGQDFVCSKEGYRQKKYVYRKDRVLPQPPATREGCSAMLRVALRDGVKWVVTKFVKDHNHCLMCPSKVPLRGSGKTLSQDDKDKRIRELTIELNNERQRCKRRCEVYKQQLNVVLKYMEEHMDHMSRSVQEIVQHVREAEDKQLDGLD